MRWRWLNIVLWSILLTACTSADLSQSDLQTNHILTKENNEVNLTNEHKTLLNSIQGSYTDFYNQQHITIMESMEVYEVIHNGKKEFVAQLISKDNELWELKSKKKSLGFIKKTDDGILFGDNPDKMITLHKFDFNQKKISGIDFSKFESFIGDYHCSIEDISLSLGITTNNRVGMSIKKSDLEQFFICDDLNLSNDTNQLFFDITYNNQPLKFRIAKISNQSLLLDGEGKYKKQLILKRVS
ncbi:hypothetical protein [Vagococcus xieshaowenii]|uniref:Lipoprotein n=1 Tax=Vagococcus xieshaowenii TaxID=2562451 RepID=A0AAJ5EDZ4_9ENTE|nr:hypothetical protein [Vagococcus xieshaowenii]QCA28532.1 hypothetical protein E4Z98_04090 [Vagococcus xieshaowenii]TFZ40660.1 hypothetical protein E4031_07685 [Vagococcus xieshaowenii]